MRRIPLRIAIAALACLRPVALWAFPIPVAGEFVVNAHTTGYQRRSHVGMDSTGNFVVVWTDYASRDGSQGGIFGRRFSAGGTPLASDFAVNTFTTGNQGFPEVASDAAGNFVVVWDSDGVDGDGFGVAARRFDAAGSPIGSEFLVNTATTGHQLHSSVAVDAAGNFLVVWFDQTPAHVLGQRFDAAGVAQGSAFQIETSPALGGPRVAVDSAGGFGVAWVAAAGVAGQRLDAAGSPIGTEFQVNSVASSIFLVDVASDDAGNLIVVWQGTEPVGGSQVATGIFGQRVSNLGVPIGGEFQVNSYTKGRQSAPTVVSDPAGGFVVSFQSPRGYQMNYNYGGVSGIGIDARRFDASGAPIGPEFRVNPKVLSMRREYPSAAMASDGTFVVVWDSRADSAGVEGADLAARRFDRLASAAASKLVIVDNPTNPAKRKIVFRVLDGLVSTDLGAGVNPVADGAYLHVYNAAGSPDSTCLFLPAAGWTAGGDLGQPVYKYKDSLAANGPCKALSVKNGKLIKASCKASEQPISYTLDEAQQQRVAVRFISGDVTYCALFEGGGVLADSGTMGKFVGRNAVAPSACPVPPSPCP